MNKRTFLKNGLILGAGSLIIPSINMRNTMAYSLDAERETEFKQIPLGYSFNALEPHIDAQTMEIHYTKHHAGYTSKFNASVKEENLSGKTIHEILSRVNEYSASIRNNGGGYYNHNFFWQCLSPDGGGQPKKKLLKAIISNFGSFENFKEEFSGKALSVFGSGWAWLIKQEGKLKIISTPNQDNPLMKTVAEKGTPLLAIDVWEHAYYLNYQNRRADYIKAFWNIVNWDFVAANYSS